MGNEMLVAPRITHEDGAVLSRRKYAHALNCNFSHFICEFSDVVQA
jgi:hypothetical protein